MAFGVYGGATVEETVLREVAAALLGAESAADVFTVVTNYGGKIGYTPISYLMKLIHQGETDAGVAASVVKHGWGKGESPFVSSTTVSSGGRKERVISAPVAVAAPEPVAVDPTIAFLMSL